jgi:hypothetical protein
MHVNNKLNMNKKEFKKYQTKIITINLLLLILMYALTILALYNKNINNILFAEKFLPEDIRLFLNLYFERYFSGNSGFLWGYIWGFGAVLLLPVDIKYFIEKKI